METSMLNQLIGEEQTGNLVSILSVFPQIPVHITGIHGPTGKSALCRKLRENGINAFEDWELEDREKDNSNAVYIEIALSETDLEDYSGEQKIKQMVNDARLSYGDKYL